MPANIPDDFDASYDEVLRLASDPEARGLFALADGLREKFFGRKFETCSIMNARGGACSEDCKWCSQSARHSTHAKAYPLVPKEEILEFARHFDERKVSRFSIVTSGRSVSAADTQKLAEAYAFLRGGLKISLCGSLGLLTETQLRTLKDAGMTRYHCNLETAPSHFPKLCTTHTIEDKLETISAARRVGLEICSGGIIGMGETLDQRVEFAFALKKIGVESIPVNILNPIKGTPLESVPPLGDDEILRAFAIFKIANPRAHIRFAGGRARIAAIQEKALSCGVSAALVGDMLTTLGSNIDEDFAMLERLGYELA